MVVRRIDTPEISALGTDAVSAFYNLRCPCYGTS